MKNIIVLSNGSIININEIQSVVYLGYDECLGFKLYALYIKGRESIEIDEYSAKEIEKAINKIESE